MYPSRDSRGICMLLGLAALHSGLVMLARIADKRGA